MPREKAMKRPPPLKTDLAKRPTGSFTLMREGGMLLFLAILVFSIYSNTLGGPFLFDDEANIENNPNIRLTILTPEGLEKAGLKSLSSNRPVSNISFALNYFFHHYDVRGYHLINILIHIITGILLYLFIKTTSGIMGCGIWDARYAIRKSSKEEGQIISSIKQPVTAKQSFNLSFMAFFAALIWLVHPIQTQSVAYIVQRMNSMAAMFYLLSILLYAKARLAEEKGKKWALFAGCILAGLLALGSKEIAVTLPFFIFLYEYYFFRGLSRTWLRRHLFLFAGILILLAIVAFLYLGAHPFERILSGYGSRDFTLAQRVLTEFRVVIFYISLLVFPHPSRLNLEHDFPLSYSLIDPITTLFSIGVITGLIGLAIYMARKDRLLSFCILWFFGNLVIESSVIGLEIIFEHRTYLPSMLVSLMAVTLAFRYLKQKRLRLTILCLVVTVFSVWTYERNSAWGDSVALWSDCVEKSPKKARPHSNLGRALAEKGRADEGISHLREALRIKPGYAVAHNNLGTVLEKQGRLKEAVSHYSEAIRIIPHFANAHYNLGVALHRKGNIEGAIKHYTEALRIKPDHALAHNNLGVALQSQKKLEEALSHYAMALTINPEYADARRNLERAQSLIGKSK